MTRIESGGARDNLWRTALESIAKGNDSDALRQLFEQRSAELRGGFESGVNSGAEPAAASNLATDGLRTLDAEMKQHDRITTSVLTGEIDSPHEVASQIRRADLTLKFSLEIRNRLIDAYREVMRMSV